MPDLDVRLGAVAPPDAGRCPERPARRHAVRRPVHLLTAVAVLLLALLVPQSPALADDPIDPLAQRVGAQERVSDEEAVLTRGHVDIGPRFVDGRWTLLLRDDARQPAVWRSADRTVLQVPDGPGQLPVPDDPAYAFLGQPPGTKVYVVPQTQDPDVVWAGWNTQDPEVVQRLDRGATLRLLGVQGSGDLVVFLQDGGFSAPDVLWDSRSGGPQDIWMDANTHTHANWVFSGPGVYLVRTELRAQLRDGTAVSTEQTLRFAVGSATDLQDAATRGWAGQVVEPTAAPGAPSAEAPTDGAAQPGTSGTSGPTWPLVAAGTGLLLLVLGILVARSALLARSARRAAQTEGDEGDGVHGGDEGGTAGDRGADRWREERGR